MQQLDPLLAQTRRHFFKDCAMGLGSLALADIMQDGKLFASAGGGLHHAAKAKKVIFLFMAGGPSQLDLFDEKPELVKWNGKPIPQEF
ncbi:MAG: DUF1501 domain-containing protein, partial [Planctomycetia bacterium]